MAHPNRALGRVLPLALVIALLLSLATPPNVAEAAPPTDRIAGADRYATSVAASKAAFPDPTAVDTVYLAAGLNYPDALAAGPAAVAGSSGLLLTAPTSIPPVVAAELSRLTLTRIVILGGPTVISAAVESQARSYAGVVERLAGLDRFETSRLLVAQTWGATGAPQVWLATGNDYPDALAASPAAGSSRSPLLLIDGKLGGLDAASRALLLQLGTTSVAIAGAPAVVSAGIEAELKQLLGTDAVSRHGGADRYETARLINQSAFAAAPPGDAYVATGLDFPDALSVAVLAGTYSRPLYLSWALCAPRSLVPVLSGPNTTRIRLVGGVGVVRSHVATLQDCRNIDSASSITVVTNKNRRLNPVGYVPSDLVVVPVPRTWTPQLRVEASNAVGAMFNAAYSEAGLSLASNSAYRSFEAQAQIYAGDDNLTARPGYSEHQTGLAIDIGAVSGNCSLSACFGSTLEGSWLYTNAWRFGFLMRYPSDKSAITGYDFEPWHYRYIGTQLAAEMRADGFRTLEEYFGLPPAPVYP